MDLYEYQGKELFKRVGIPVSDGRLPTTPEEARAAAEEIGGAVVVKAQVLTGGRGKAGGVKLAEDPDDAEQKAEDILGLDINGHVVRRLWIERASDIAKEYYLSIAFDRGAKQPLFMFTTQGGVEIEQVAEENPDALIRLHVDPLEGYQPWIARKLIYDAGVEDPSEQKQIAAIVEKLYRAFVEFDAMLCRDQPADRHARRRGEGARLEVHGRRQRALPSSGHRGVARHERCRSDRGVRAREGRHLREARRRRRHLRQRRRALDVDAWTSSRTSAAGRRTSATSAAAARPKGVVDALEVITRDPQVKSIFFNIFGGITRCDEVARGILEALERLDMSTLPDRRAARRHERRGGPPDPRRGRQAEHPSRGDDARGRRAGRGAGRTE